MEGFVEQAGETEIANFHLPRRRDHDVGWFEITVEDPVGVQVLAAVEELEHDALDGVWRDGMPRLLGVVVDDLQQVVLGVLKDHEYALVLEDDFDELDDVGVVEFGAEGHFSHGGLRDARVGDLLAFLVRLELLDGELAWLAMATMSLVDTAIGATGNETNDFVFVCYSHFALILDGSSPVTWVYCEVLVLCFVTGPMKTDRMMSFAAAAVAGS